MLDARIYSPILCGLLAVSTSGCPSDDDNGQDTNNDTDKDPAEVAEKGGGDVHGQQRAHAVEGEPLPHLGKETDIEPLGLAPEFFTRMESLSAIDIAHAFLLD